MTLTKRQRLLLVAPVITLPFLTMFFYSLGGGRGIEKGKAGRVFGLNTELPGLYIDPGKEAMNKLGAYLKAEQDSIRKKEFERLDPYRTQVMRRKDSIRPSGDKADELLKQLDRLQTSLQEPVRPVMRQVVPSDVRSVLRAESPVPPAMRVMPRLPVADTPASDPQLDRLNTMLDKVIRIQHPGERQGVAKKADDVAEEVMPADSASNAIAAVIPTDQVLVAGGTIALQLSEDVLVHGVPITRGQWVYGTVTISNDRMLVHVRSLRSGRNLYNADLQVYDLDGLPGIHIPGMLSRDVAKESADEGVSGVNLTTYDPSLGAQAANAGIQAAKTLFGRKVRLVRVSVRSGYAVLLRNTQDKRVLPLKAAAPVKDSVVSDGYGKTPPGFVPGGSFIQRCRAEGMELDLQGIYLRDGLLWFCTRWANHSPIGYTGDYSRWVIRDKKVFRRTAQQEEPLEAVYVPKPALVAGDSVVTQWTGFRPFALGKDKELVLEIGEKGGGRALRLVIGHRQLLNAKILQP